MAKNVLVSVIIPIYKVEQYLERCVDSIKNQTYANLEIILVDDGSPDSCGKMCDAFALTDQRIKVVHKQNGGLSDARNAGIKCAQGAYYLFVDSDDYIAQDMIEILVKDLEEADADIAMCTYDLFDENDVHTQMPFDQAGPIVTMSGAEAAKRLLFYHEPQMVVAWNKLAKRELWENRIFPVGKQHEDDFTSYSLLYESSKVTVRNEALYHYFQRRDSIIGVGFNLRSLHKIEAYLQAKDYFKDKDQTLYDRCCNMVLIMNKNCMKAAMSSQYHDKKAVIAQLRKEGRAFYRKYYRNIKRGLPYHMRLILFYYFGMEV